MCGRSEYGGKMCYMLSHGFSIKYIIKINKRDIVTVKWSKNIQQNLNMLHNCALNIIRIHKRETQSKLPLNGIMFRALMNPQALLPLLGKTRFPLHQSVRDTERPPY